jgi:hypothetical protein
MNGSHLKGRVKREVEIAGREGKQTWEQDRDFYNAINNIHEVFPLKQNCIRMCLC